MYTHSQIETALLLNPEATIKDLIEFTGYSSERVAFELRQLDIKKSAYRFNYEVSKNEGGINIKHFTE